MRTVAIVNQKGGCGKTTTAINLAGVLARMGQRTLLVDLDPQGHCAVGLGIPDDRIDLHVGDAMLMSPTQRLDETRLLWRISRNLDLAPSAMKLAGLEAARGGLADAEDRDQRLAAVLARFEGKYDWTLIDCPPSIGLLTFNALRAANEAVIPVETSFFAMKGADRQVRTIRSLARRLGGQTPYRILATMHAPESPLAVELLNELEQQFGERLIPEVIRLDPRLKEATTFGQPVCDFDPEANGARDYTAVAEFLVETPPGKARGRGLSVSVTVRAERRPSAASTRRQIERAPVQPGASPERPLNAPPPAPPVADEQAFSRAADVAARARTLLARCVDAPVAASGNGGGAVSVSTKGPLQVIEEAKPTADFESTHARLSRVFGVTETSGGVLFVQPAPADSDISVAGDFNNWSPRSHPLRFNPSLGVFEARVDLPAGRNEYRLVVNGHWMPDPYNRNTTTNPFGEQNSVIVVTRRRTNPMVCEGAD